MYLVFIKSNTCASRFSGEFPSFIVHILLFYLHRHLLSPAHDGNHASFLCSIPHHRGNDNGNGGDNGSDSGNDNGGDSTVALFYGVRVFFCALTTYLPSI